MTTPTTTPTERKPHLVLVLIVIASAQLMVVLDGTITNIALPSIQTDLDVPASRLAWVVNGYALAFGGLLLLGGRSGDLFGRRRMFRIGITLFTLASLLGGLAANEAMLIGARVLQGIGGAIAAPTALSLIATTFPEGKPRNTAMGVYAAMSGLGSTVGLLLGGVLTDVDWRWVFFVNVPVGVAVLLGTRLLPSGERNPGRLDISGAIVGTAGLLALVYAITRSADYGWTDPLTLGCFAAAVALLVAFVVLQARSRAPMMPLRLFADHNRSGAYATMLLIGAGMFATFYFLTLYMQQVLGYSPVRTGLAYMPFSAGMILSAGLGSRLISRVAPRTLAGPGLVVGVAGMAWFGFLEPDSSYVAHLMPAMLVTGLGLGFGFVPMALAAVSGVADRDTGIASALLNTSQQIGGALGLAALSTVATTAADDHLPAAAEAFRAGLARHDFALVQRAAEAMTHGYTRAFLVSSGLLAVAVVVVVTMVRAGRPRTTGDTEARTSAEPSSVELR